MEYLAESKIYENIKLTLKKAQQKVYYTVNFVMVETYWDIGKQIYEAQGKNERAEYGKGLLKFLSEKLTRVWQRVYCYKFKIYASIL